MQRQQDAVDYSSVDGAYQVKRTQLGLINEFIAPGTPMEIDVAEIWRDVLNLDEIGVEDDFFDLRGDSLAATTIAAAVSSNYGIKFQPSMLMTTSTVAALIAAIEKKTHEAKVTSTNDELPAHMVPVCPKGKLSPLFIIHGNFGISLPKKVFVDEFSREQPLYFLQAIGYMGEIEPPKTIENIARSYLNSMRIVQPTGPLNIASFCAGGFIAVEVARILVEMGDKPATVVLVDPTVPFRLKPKYTPIWLRVFHRRFRQQTRMLLLSLGVKKRDRTSEKIANKADQNGSWKDLELQNVRTAQKHLTDAFINYAPTPYAGKLEVIGCKDHHGGNERSRHPWMKLLTGAHLQIVGDTHADVLTHNSNEVARIIQSCVIEENDRRSLNR
jgi:thioesterase domain-containing protein/acyl carrier protein